MDKDAVLAFCAHTFDDGDYLPEVWDDWLADPKGQLLIGVLNGVPVGAAKVSMLTSSEAWLEGLRVDERYRHRGLAWQFHLRCLRTAHDLGAEVARLVTSSRNTAVHRIAERVGMRHVASCLDMIASALPPEEGSAPLVPLRPDDWPHVSARVLSSPILEKTHGLYGVWCCWQALTEAKLRTHLAQGQVLSLPQKPLAANGPAIIVEARWEALPVAYVDAAGARLEALALALRRQAACAGLPAAEMVIPDDATLRQALERAGYKNDMEPEAALWIYEIDCRGALP
jgi:GNAT superfamily N-acetyltransferase